MSTLSLFELPNELIELIFSYLNIRDIFRTESTCFKWKKLIWTSQTEAIWPFSFSEPRNWHAIRSAIHKLLMRLNPAKIRKLNLNARNYMLDDQDSAALNKMNELQHLTLTSAHMATRQHCYFIYNLTKLQSLSLHTLSIQECIDCIGSAPLPHLTSLTMHAVPLHEISPLRNLTQLRALDLRFCAAFADSSFIDLFTSLTLLETLDISRITDMNSASFESISCLTNLTDLSIGHVCLSGGNDNRKVLNNVLSPLSKLKSLDMNYIVEYNNETIKIISEMSDLTRLCIYFEAFRPAAALSKLTNMQYLHMSCDSDKRIPDRFYSGMTNLTSLTVRMETSELPNLERLTRMKSLTINSKLQFDGSLYPYLLKMTQLEQLDFQYSTFSAMKLGLLSSLQFLTSLRIIDISYIKKDTNDVIDSLTQLTGLRTLTTRSGWDAQWLLKFPYLESLEVQYPSILALNNGEVSTVLTPLLSLTKLHTLRVGSIPCSTKSVKELFRYQRNLTSLNVNTEFI